MGDVVVGLGVIYRLAGDDRSWLDGVTAALVPHLDRGHGVFGHLFSPDRVTVARVAFGGDAAALPRRRTDEAGWVQRVLAIGNGGATMELTTEEPHGVRDAFGIVASDPGGLSLVVYGPRSEGARDDAPSCGAWARVCEHFAHALRLRRTLPALAAEATREGAMREHGAVRRLGPEEALAEWTALVAGSWAFVDHIEADGRRVILARRNPVLSSRLPALTPAEAQAVGFALLGHSNKAIAHELGVGEGAVAMRLSRACRKLGVRTRVALIDRARRALEQRA